MKQREATAAVTVLSAAGLAVRVARLRAGSDEWGVENTVTRTFFGSLTSMPQTWQAAILEARTTVTVETIDVGRSSGWAIDRSFQPTRRSFDDDPRRLAAQAALQDNADAAGLMRAYAGLAELLDSIVDGSKNRRLKNLEQAAGRLARAHDVAQQMAAVHTALMDALTPDDGS